MVERVIRYRETVPLMEAFGVDQEIKSTLHRRVDLPSGGYLIFDYAEAFTVIDVNTGRFVGSRGKNSGARLEDTITKNNLEAVKEVVRQLRLRDIGGIIVIDFIDMANPKNRVAVEEALRTELERDRTKTYVVEISPLGLVEMTRQNVTDGPRELMTKKCPTCGGDGIVYSEASAAIDVERRLRSLVAGSRSQAYRVELSAPIAAVLIGPGARRLQELETMTKRRFFLDGKPDMHVDHFVVLAEGKLADLAPKAPVEEGVELSLDLVEIDRHDGGAAVGKVEGFDVCVADAASLVGKKVKARVERVLDGVAYATLVRALKKVPEPLTAEAEAEKPTRKPPARKGADAQGGPIDADADDGDDEAPEDSDLAVELEEPAEDELDVVGDEAIVVADVAVPDSPAPVDGEAAVPAKKKTRRGSRGGKNRKKPAGTGATASTDPGAEPGEPEALQPVEEKKVTIHLPGDELGREDEAVAAVAEIPSENGAAVAAKKKTRRGSRGGKNRRKPGTGVAQSNGTESNGTEPVEIAAEPESSEPAEPVEKPVTNGAPDDDWGYVPMSEWVDELEG
jgi:ribonuclease G